MFVCLVPLRSCMFTVHKSVWTLASPATIGAVQMLLNDLNTSDTYVESIIHTYICSSALKYTCSALCIQYNSHTHAMRYNLSYNGRP